MIIPAIRYRDPEAALLFLVGVLGLDEHAVRRDDDGAFLHAELRLGDGLVSIRGLAGQGRPAAPPADPAGRAGPGSMTIYAVVPDPAHLHARVLESGAQIVAPLSGEGPGGSAFSVADPEGHVWTFGSYNPLSRD
ncbi:VOC family protein [Rhodovulum sulfidophilum]|uniref:VOC family protein n=1 Tax=Rhodovulum sulfidophilum TaxID=35806 RepID=UPI001922B947|nr:VOC family protein [Rhodovulum sulfidophilum]MBL3561006.1 VOC family protein [Rhodovulum sulfidophilum]